MKKKQKMVTITLRLPKELIKKIDWLAKKEGISRNAWIRKTITKWLGMRNEKRT